MPRSLPRATGVPPMAMCSVPIGSGMSSTYSALPCTCLAPLSCGSGLWTWRGGPSSTSFGGIGERPVIGNARRAGAYPGHFGKRLDHQGGGDAAAVGGAGAQIGERREILVDGGGGRLPAARIVERQS